MVIGCTTHTRPESPEHTSAHLPFQERLGTLSVPGPDWWLGLLRSKLLFIPIIRHIPSSILVFKTRTMLAQPLQRSSHLHHTLRQPQHHQLIQLQSQQQYETSSQPTSHTHPRPHTDYLDLNQSWKQQYTALASQSQQSAYDSNFGANSFSAAQNELFNYNVPHNTEVLHRQHLDAIDQSRTPELMHSEQSAPSATWNFSTGQLTPTSARAHCRESSLSSVGSAGPSSPYHSSTPHPPHIIIHPDSDANYVDGLPSFDQSLYQTFAKPLTPSHTPSHESFQPLQYQQAYNYQYHANQQIAALLAMQRAQHAAADDDSMAPPEFSHSSRPSIASTHDSPATPPVATDYEDRKTGELGRTLSRRWVNEYLPSGSTEIRNNATIPKLDRTMSDAYNDELYNPNITITSAPAVKADPATTSHAHNPLISQLLHAANSTRQQNNGSVSLTGQGSTTAFREGSPLAPSLHQFASSPQMRFGSAQQIRERQKAEDDDRVLREQIQRTSPSQDAPSTISPRDALIEYHETEEDAAMPLFPQQRASPQYTVPSAPVREQTFPDFDETASQQSFRSMATTRRESSSGYSTTSTAPLQQTAFAFAPPSVPGSIRVPQQYPFVPQPRQESHATPAQGQRRTELPTTLTSMESSQDDYMPDGSPEEPILTKPAGASADGGTYTCTYHGCTLRFETPAKLQKHKREGHRQSAPLSGSGSISSSNTTGMTSDALLRNSQAGPHRCDRINPSTGKPCNTIFSRPYDLTRHEDTIHNARKTKVRCHICKEEKLFSRNDALTRHFRVCHPLEPIPGRKRRQHD